MFLIERIGENFGLFEFTNIRLIKIYSSLSKLEEEMRKLANKPTSWPTVGSTYWFVTTPDISGNVSVNQGTITEDLMEKIDEFVGETKEYGNIFQTKEQAMEMAKKVAELFE